MSDTKYKIAPFQIFLAAVGLGLAMAAVAIWIALSQPQVDFPADAVPTRVGDIDLIDTDLMEEPDQLGSFAAIRAFYARQDLLREQLEGDSVTVTLALADGSVKTERFEVRSRHFSDLPGAFWFQMMVGLISLFFGGWVLGLRREDWGARMFAITSVMVPVFAMAASVYSTRQIALDGSLFRVLSAINIGGAVGFGIALVGLFAMYPQPLFRPRWLLLPLAIYGVCFAMAVGQFGIDNIGALTVLSQMVVALALGLIQWVRSRREPLNRAGLRWFVLICLAGCSLFIGLVAAPPVLGLADGGLIPQGYAFGFFNLMHFGLALGVLRFRVFDLDRWSYYIWLWLSGFVMIVVLDIAIVRLLQAQPWMSLSAALLCAGLLYFPLRQFLLNLILRRRKASLSGRLADIITTALSPTQSEHAKRWDALLTAVFEPLAPVETLNETVLKPRIEDSGLELIIPSVIGSFPRRLQYAQQGRRLFTPDDLEVVANLVQMHDLATESREAYDRGIILERDRISRDIHDNIGAQLLTALHSREPARKDDLLRDSLSDLRAIINDGFLASYPLEDVIADLRKEAVARLEANYIVLNWEGPDFSAGRHPKKVSFSVANGLRSILREAISNVVRHANATVVDVEMSCGPDEISLRVTDNGTGISEAELGNGITNIVARAEALNGTGSVLSRNGTQSGTVVKVLLPFEGAEMVQAT